MAARVQESSGRSKLPRARQTQPVARRGKRRAAAQKSLTRAFLTFTQAAGSLEKSYAQLQGEVTRLRGELERANVELSRSLEQNTRVRAFLAHVLERLPCGVVVTDGQQHLRMANPEARRLLGLEASWTPGLDAASAPAVEKLLAGAPSEESSLEQEWSSASLRSNRIIGISRAKVEPVESAEAETIWILRDITDQKRVAAEREAARQERALAEIAAILAHEIRNPLGSMELFAGLLGDATAHMPETRQWVTHLQAGLRSLAATVNNVLQFHSTPPSQLLPASLDRLLRDTVEFLGPLARQRGIEIMLENTLGRAAVAADAPRLQQVFFNLALNAFRAMPPGKKLTIRLRSAPQFPGGIALVEFLDQGHGIPAELLDRIFEPGFTTAAGSPGLGLSVCRKVVEQHAGKMEVESKLGQGATFRVFLPISGGEG